jgi:hypothetical protein
MVQVDIPAAFTLGQFFALLTKKYLKSEKQLFSSRLLGLFTFYLTFGFIPVGMYFMVGWPSWEVMYVTGWVEHVFNNLPVIFFYIGFMMLMIILGEVGYIVGHLCFRKGKDTIVVIGAVAGTILTFLPFVVRWGVWWKIGTYAEFLTGTGYSFFKPPFVIGWVIIMLYWVIMTVVFGMIANRQSNKLSV